MKTGKRRRLIYRSIAIAVFLGCVYFILYRNASSFTVKPIDTFNSLPRKIHESTPNRPARLAALDVRIPALLLPNPDHSEIAFRALKGAYKKLISARSFTQVTDITNSDGNRVKFILSSSKDSNGTLFLRGETINYDQRTNEPIPRRNRIEISNREGNWELRGTDPIEDVAFLRQDAEIPSTSMGSYQANVEMANQGMDPNRHYSERDEVYRGRSSKIVSESNVSIPNLTIDYVIDQETENLSQMNIRFPSSMTCETHFEINPPIPSALFEIPDSKLILPTNDIESDAVTISDQVKQKR